ncbi:hypothetical protein CBM2595_A80012 [Cupriavidus taiwanensis]|nr:hypothetical protein CBM2595_A80012 [Cupriavidus taiwanensis]
MRSWLQWQWTRASNRLVQHQVQTSLSDSLDPELAGLTRREARPSGTAAHTHVLAQLFQFGSPRVDAFGVVKEGASYSFLTNVQSDAVSAADTMRMAAIAQMPDENAFPWLPLD